MSDSTEPTACRHCGYSNDGGGAYVEFVARLLYSGIDGVDIYAISCGKCGYGTTAVMIYGWASEKEAFEIMRKAWANRNRVPEHTCQVVQHSDQMVCNRCARAWDVNDPDQPKCEPFDARDEL